MSEVFHNRADILRQNLLCFVRPDTPRRYDLLAADRQTLTLNCRRTEWLTRNVQSTECQDWEIQNCANLFICLSSLFICLSLKLGVMSKGVFYFHLLQSVVSSSCRHSVTPPAIHSYRRSFHLFRHYFQSVVDSFFSNRCITQGLKHLWGSMGSWMCEILSETEAGVAVSYEPSSLDGLSLPGEMP